MRRTKRAYGRTGLTLVEAIVCMSVLVMLVALLCSCGGIFAAREKSRRVACLNNLRQMAVGLQSYCSDYGQYFPCYPAYGSDPQPLKGKHWDTGIYQNPMTGQRLRTGNRAYYAGPSRYRCVSYGSRFKDAPAMEPLPFKAGNLNTAPIGIGHLLAGQYLEDARVFFCPSAESVPKMEGYGALTAREELQRVGGFDWQALGYGDYTWAQSYYKGQSDRGVLCSYNYRDVPLAVDPKLALEEGYFPVPHVQPRTMTAPGCPTFKTQRQLACRAVACDSFDRPSKPLAERGMAQFVHREGHNVLYGDWAARWYGDPSNRILEMPWPAGTPTDASQGSDVSYIPATPTNNTAIAMWHMFDEHNGIDAGF